MSVAGYRNTHEPRADTYTCSILEIASFHLYSGTGMSMSSLADPRGVYRLSDKDDAGWPAPNCSTFLFSCYCCDF